MMTSKVMLCVVGAILLVVSSTSSIAAEPSEGSAASNEYLWLHVSGRSIRTSPAAKQPDSSFIPMGVAYAPGPGGFHPPERYKQYIDRIKARGCNTFEAGNARVPVSENRKFQKGLLDVCGELRVGWLVWIGGQDEWPYEDIWTPVAKTSASPMPAASPDDIPTFLKAYRQKAASLERSYSQVAIEAKVNAISHRVGQAFDLMYHIEILRSDGQVRAVSTADQSTKWNWPAGSVQAFVGNADCHCEMLKPAGKQHWVYEWAGKSPDFWSKASDRAGIAFWPYQIWDTRLVDWFDRNRIIGLEKAALDARPAMVVTCEYKADNGKPSADRIYLDPDTWALMGCDLIRGGEAIHSRTRYQAKSVPPIIESRDNWRVNTATGEEVERARIDVLRMTFGPSDKQLFTLKAIGAEHVPGEK